MPEAGWDELDAYASDVLDAESVSDASSDASSTGDGVDVDERAELLRAPVLSICSALGGYEAVERDGRVEQVYCLGDDCLGALSRVLADAECLRDLRRLWREDDSDASRAMARVLAELGTLHNDLIPILLHTAGGAEKEANVALACSTLRCCLY